MSAIEFSGAEVTFTQLEGEAKVFDWVFERDGVRMDVGDVLFSGVVTDADEAVVGDVVLEHVSGEPGTVRVRFPKLEVGTYEFEIRYSSSAGAVGRIAFGRIGVVSSELLLEVAEELPRDTTTMLVKLPSKAGGYVQLEWAASSVAMAAAERALAAAEKLQGVDATLERLEAQVEEFRVFTVKWHNDIKSVLVMNPVTGTIWVGGHDTGQPYRGEDGKAPRVNAYGNWETYDGHQWNDIGVRAFGKDGVDGDKVRRVLLASVHELPEGEERGVLYYVPRSGGGYDLWAWVEPVGWLCVGTDAYGYASAETMGMMKLATDLPVTDGAPVGFNAQKQAMVPGMTTSVAGSAKLSTSAEMSLARKDGVIGQTASGQLMARRARSGQAGVVEPSRTDNLARVLGVGIVPDGTMVDGLDRSGQLGCTRAQADTYGMVKVAFVSTNEACNNVEWNVPIGIRDDMQEAVQGTSDTWYRGANGMLYVPLTVGGALHWVSSGERTKDGRLYSTGGALDLRVSAQFRVGAAGLELLAATEERLAGVRIATGNDDMRDEAVPRARDVAWREDVYSKEDAVLRFMSTAGGCLTVKVCKGEGALPPADEQEKGVLYIGI